ncbi:OmpA family protein [Flavobacteriales bacterium]|nr:OmpA family protein [Flavobacteriales bacterium]
MRFIIFIFLVGCNLTIFSQNCFPEKAKDKRAVKKIEKLIEKRDFYDALDKLRAPSDYVVFYALKAEIFWLRGNFFNAEEEGLSAINACPENFPKVYYFLGEIAFNRKDYVNADLYLKKSISLGISDPYYSDAIMLYEKARVLAEIINNPVPFNPTIVKGISTKYDEYLPVISPDQELFFFTRKSLKDGIGVLVPTYVEEFIGSKKNKGQFSQGSVMPYPFNQESNEGGASITIDNKTLYYTKCIRNKKGYNNCDIYYVNRLKEKWSEVGTFSNSISRHDTWESQPTVSSDGKTIIFASDRSGGYGKMDLYEINLVDGHWTTPKNLGSAINSNEYEKSPYLHADGKTLFFASTNFPSLGGFDIFFSRKDSLGNWQKPINIGYPINSVSDEISLFVSTDGNKAFFASNQLNGIGGWDVYSFDLHDGAKPARVLFLQGDLLDENGVVIEDVELDIKNIQTNEVTTIKVAGGAYVSSLTLGEDDDVLISIKKEGFAFNSTYIAAEDPFFDSPTRLDIEMQNLEEGRSFNIENIYFDNNSFEVKEMAKQVLIEFSEYLNINNTLVIEINGFTDDVGDIIDNQLLSENRAKAVYNLVLSSGVAKNRLSYNGFGEQFPIADNTSEFGRSQNRRTEFKIISK